MKAPSLDQWLSEAKADPSASQCGMYLCHNGVVRETPKAKVRSGIRTDQKVSAVKLTSDPEKVNAAIADTKALPGIFYVRVWLNEGTLSVGDDIMLVLIGGDIRPHVTDALLQLVGELKTNCVREEELFEP